MADSTSLLDLFCIPGTEISEEDYLSLFQCFEDKGQKLDLFATTVISLTDRNNPKTCALSQCIETLNVVQNCSLTGEYEKFACRTEAQDNIWGIVLLFLFLFFLIACITLLRGTQIGALIQKNFHQRKNKKGRSICVQVFETCVIIVLAVTISLSTTATVVTLAVSTNLL